MAWDRAPMMNGVSLGYLYLLRMTRGMMRVKECMSRVRLWSCEWWKRLWRVVVIEDSGVKWKMKPMSRIASGVMAPMMARFCWDLVPLW